MNQLILKEDNLYELKGIINKYNTSQIFLVTGKTSFIKSGAKDFLKNYFGIDASFAFSDFASNPKIDDLLKGVSLFNQSDYKLVIAVGGGSVLDMAKLISVFARQNDIELALLNKIPLQNVKIPLVAIPTTSGSGAEATSFSVLYFDKVKHSISHELLLPDFVFLSPKFTFSSSPYLTAYTGLDAFCQAVESVWSVNSNSESESYAYKAVDIIWNNLKKAVRENNDKAKAELQTAALLAGRAINITKTTAPHALSYAYTSYYELPHGHAVAMSLPFFFEYNYGISDADCLDSRGAENVKARISKLLDILNIESKEIQSSLIAFFLEIGVNINAADIITNFDPEIIINNINLARLKNNPRAINFKVLTEFITPK
jgi:alcohol dehydrogenase class IV